MYLDRTGAKFGRLTVIKRVPNSKNSRNVRYLCQCSCGSRIVVQSGNLATGHTRSCGCFQKEKTSARFASHGKYGSPTYRSWSDMIQRCENPSNTEYENYGGRGITVYVPWHIFKNFYADMGDKPTSKHSLERKDVNGNYDASNCVWATQKEQQNNRRNNRMIEIGGKIKTLHQWADHSGINYGTLWSRLNVLGWPIEKALAEPTGPQGYRKSIN